jgi:creatinine amidohydrolase
LGELTSPEIAEAIAAGIDVALLPVGSTEQHGAHLPMATDSIHTFAVLERAADALPALVAPLLPIGRAEHHMAFAGTMSVKQETLHALVRDCCESLFAHGFRRVLIWSGHGGNAGPLARIVEALRAEMGRSIIGCTDWEIYDEALFPCAERLGVDKFAAGWHAGELETSMILELAPELVLMERAAPDFLGELAGEVRDRLMADGVQAIAPSGVLGDPRSATRANGYAYMQALSDSVTAFFRAALDEARAAEKLSQGTGDRRAFRA